MNDLDLVLSLVESGRVALPDPLVHSTAVGAPLLDEVGDDRFLPAVAEGACVLAVGLQSHLPDADVYLMPKDGALYAVTRDQAERTPVRSVDHARALYTVAWTPDAATLLHDAASEALARAELRGACATAAQLVGLGQAWRGSWASGSCVLIARAPGP